MLILSRWTPSATSIFKPVGDEPVIGRPEAIGLHEIDRAELLLLTFSENLDEAIPIEERLAASQMDLRLVAGEYLERSPGGEAGLDGHQPALAGRAMIITELARRIAPVREHQPRRPPELELRLVPDQMTIVHVIR